MKLNKLWASVLALMALASCGRDLEPSVNMPTPEQPAAEYQLVRMDIKATQDDNALRVGYGVSDDEDGALTGLALAEKNVNLRIAVKQGLNGTPVVDTYSFTKVGRASFAFSDNIKVPVKQGNEPYYMAAVLVSEGTKDTPDYLEYATLDESKYPTRVIFPNTKNETLLLADSENKIYPNIPYRSEWTEISMNTEGTSISRATIKLAPLGTLLRFCILNTTKFNQDIFGIVFDSPTFTNKGDIDFARNDHGRFPRWNPYTSIQLGYNLPEKITLKPNEKSPWYYMWVKSYTYTENIRPEPVTVRYCTEDGGAYVETPIFKTKKLLRNGSIKVTFKIRSASTADADFDEMDELGDFDELDPIYEWQGTVLRRVSEGVLNVTEDGFVDVESGGVRDTSVGYYTFQNAQKFTKPIPIMLKGMRRKYSLPTANEMSSIFPRLSSVDQIVVVRFDRNDQVKENVLERRITINGSTQDYTADYKWVNVRGVDQGTYAIRFKDTSNKHRTAFKYKLEGNPRTNVVLKITARLLGSDPKFDNLTVHQVAEKSFWEDSQGIYDERIFPFYGSDNARATDSRYDYNKRAEYWTSSYHTLDHGYFASANFGSASTSYVVITDFANGVSRSYPVFLFERK